MQCPRCGGGFEFAGGGQHARCMRCLTLFQMGPQGPTQVQVQAPGGGQNQEFENMMAQNLGFGPPPPGAGRHNIPDMRVGDMNVRVKINGMTPENYAKDKVSSMVWGWIIGAIVIVLLIIGGGILGIYVWYQAKSSGTASVPTKTPEAATWDGKTTFKCDGNDAVALKNVKATAGVEADGNCKLTIDNCTITAPVGLTTDGNARVTMTGGSITSTTAIKAMGISNITLSGTTVKGKVVKDTMGKVIGAQ
jgi:hypothetical protein